MEEVLDNSNNTPDKIIIAFGRVAKGKLIVIHFCVSLPVDWPIFSIEGRFWIIDFLLLQNMVGAVSDEGECQELGGRPCLYLLGEKPEGPAAPTVACPATRVLLLLLFSCCFESPIFSNMHSNLFWISAVTEDFVADSHCTSWSSSWDLLPWITPGRVCMQSISFWVEHTHCSSAEGILEGRWPTWAFHVRMWHFAVPGLLYFDPEVPFYPRWIGALQRPWFLEPFDMILILPVALSLIQDVWFCMKLLWGAWLAPGFWLGIGVFSQPRLPTCSAWTATFLSWCSPFRYGPFFA